MNYLNKHWYLCVINFVDEKVEILDSLTSYIPEVVQIDLCKKVVPI